MNTGKTWKSDDIEQYRSVAKIKLQLSKENTHYLMQHPEIRGIVQTLLHEAINQQPKNCAQFAASIFDCNKSPILEIKINEHLKLVNQRLKLSKYHKHDCKSLLSSTESSHSFLSNSSLSKDIENILKLCYILPQS